MTFSTAFSNINLMGIVVADPDMTTSLEIFLLIAAISLAPAFMMMLTPFPYIVMILGFTRQAMGTNAIPPTPILTGLAIFLSFFIMAPVFTEVYEEAYIPMSEEDMEPSEAFGIAQEPIKEYMIKNTDQDVLGMIMSYRGEERPDEMEDVDFWSSVAAHAITMMNSALFFGMIIGALFVIVDLVIGSNLMIIGMMMLPPQIVSLSFKILIFVAVGGYATIVELILDTINF